MEALIGTFHIDWKLMLAQIINVTGIFQVTTPLPEVCAW